VIIKKDLEGSGHSLNKVLSLHLPGGTEENMKKLRIVGGLGKIQTKHFLNTSLEHYS
jgi:hypothetical protein